MCHAAIIGLGSVATELAFTAPGNDLILKTEDLHDYGSTKFVVVTSLRLGMCEVVND